MASGPKEDPRTGAPAPTLVHRLWFFWCAFWTVLVTVPTSTGQIVNHRFDPSPLTFRKWVRRWARGILWGMRIRVSYTEEVHLDETRPYVFVANHQNAADILALAATLPYAFGFVAKAELRRVPFIGTTIRHSPSLFIDRSTPRHALASLKEAGERIRRGMSVLVFAEGARSYGPALLPFRKGAFSLALEAGVPVVPVTILDAYRVLDERHYAARPGRISVHLGSPISPAGWRRSDTAALMEVVRERIQATLVQEQDGPPAVKRSKFV